MALHPTRAMATETTDVSLNSLEKAPSDSKGDIVAAAGDHQIKSKHPDEEISSLKKICDDNDNQKEVVKDDQSTKKSSSSSSDEATVASDIGTEEVESGRERLRRHRMEMGGRVWIPEKWGQEDSLKEWKDCNVFDASLLNNNILSARAALMHTTSAANNSTLLRRRRIENRC